MPGWKEITDFVLKHDYCCGCGVCAGVCPQHALEIRFNKHGEYKPYLTGTCTDCGLCSKVCPFINGSPNEDDIGKAKFGRVPGMKHTPETGYYLDSYVGHAANPEIRWNGASGGLTTWLLCELLERQLVDCVITVAPTGNPDKLFAYRVLADPQEVRTCSRSAYYPVELSLALQHVRTNPGRCAIVGLPCFVRPIEQARMAVPAIRAAVVFTLGLTCGQLKSKHYARYLAQMACMSRPLKRVDFRVKDPHQPASNFGFEAEDMAGNRSRLLWNEGVSDIWCSGWFSLNSCRYCDDVFAECADVVFLDAWLDPYSKDPKGTNFAIDRANLLADKAFIEGSPLLLDRIPIGDVIQSQRGALVRKKCYIAANIAMNKGKRRLIKRAALYEPTNWFRRLKNRRYRLEMVKSRYWADRRLNARVRWAEIPLTAAVRICGAVIKLTNWLYSRRTR